MKAKPGAKRLPIDLDACLQRLAQGRAGDRIAALAKLSAADSATLKQPQVQAALIAALGDSVKAVQRVAVELIVRSAAGCPSLIARLLAALEAGDPRRRWAAAFALGQLGAPPAASLPVLLENLGHADSDVRWAVHRLLLRLAQNQTKVRDQALRLAGRGRGERKKMALYLLRDLGRRDPELDRLVVATLGDADRGVRLAAINTFIKLEITAPEGLDKLRNLERHDPADGVRRAASTALRRLA